MSDYVATIPLVLAGDGRFHGDPKNRAPVARTGDSETPVLAIPQRICSKLMQYFNFESFYALDRSVRRKGTLLAFASRRSPPSFKESRSFEGYPNFPSQEFSFPLQQLVQRRDIRLRHLQSLEFAELSVIAEARHDVP